MIQIWTDGSADNMAKKKGKPSRGGYGIVMLNGELKAFCGGSYVNTTSVRMELLAVIKAMEKCKKGDVVVIHSDNQYVVNALEKNWLWNWQKSNFKGKSHIDLWRLFLKEFTRLEGKVTLRWIRGHNGTLYNELADSLAKEGGNRDVLLNDLKC